MNHHQTWKTRLAFSTLGIAVAFVGCASPTKTGREARTVIRAKHNANLAALAAQSARQDFRVGNLKSALDNIDNAIAVEPTTDAHYVLRGRILIEMNELQEARSAFMQSGRLNPSNAEAEYFLGLIYQRWSDPQEASKHYKIAFDLDPTKVDYGLAFVESLITLNRLDEASQFVSTTSITFEHEPAFRRTEGHIRLMKGEPENAAESFYQAMLLDPDDSNIAESLVHAYIQAGEYAQAQYYLQRLLNDPRTSDRTDLKHLMARCLAASDRLLEARESYIGLTKLDRTDPVLWYELGIVSLKLGDLRRADQVARTMISTWPRRADGFLLQGRVSEIRGNLTQAIGDYQQASELDPRREEIFIFLGMALEKHGEYRPAQIAYRQTLSLNPDNLQAKQLLSEINERRIAAVGSP